MARNFQFLLFLSLFSKNVIGQNNESQIRCDINVWYPTEAIKNDIRGTVIVVFDIDSLCNITNIRVEKGIGYGCDEEAIRVITDCKKQLTKLARRNCAPKLNVKQPISFTDPTD